MDTGSARSGADDASRPLTVASRPLTDDDIPHGFSLRRIQGGLWLRGCRSGPEHVGGPEDRFVFCRSDPARKIH